MTKSYVLNVRLPKELYLRIKSHAIKGEKTISDWVRPILERAAYPGKKLR